MTDNISTSLADSVNWFNEFKEEFTISALPDLLRERNQEKPIKRPSQ